MKLFLAVLLLAGVSFADSVPTDNFFLGNWTWSLPASPTVNGSDSSGFWLQNVPVVTGVIPPDGSPTINFNISFLASSNGGTQMIMGCRTYWFNSFFCDIIAGAGSDAVMFSGNPDMPTFIPGTYGGLTITSSDSVAVPEGSEWAMLGIAGLLIAAMCAKASRRRVFIG